MAAMGTSRPRSGACLCRRCTRPRPGETARPRQSGRVTHSETTPDSASAAPAMWTTTTLLTRNVDDFRQIDNGKVQEREGCSHGAQTCSLRLPRTRLSRRSSACYAHGAMRAGASDRMLPDGRPLTRCGSFTMLMTSVRVTLVLGGTAAYLGLAMLGEGGWTAFFAHPARVALA